MGLARGPASPPAINVLPRCEISARHCEERSNPGLGAGKLLDCFATLAMTGLWSRGKRMNVSKGAGARFS
ncbi:hypothetical protein DY467_22635 [Rhodopseudomonas sp. BR0G17]|nr:hypothetical protein [Rhodopseudomonas sp. BR0G17]